MAWDPAQIRDENKLFLTDEEKQRIYENFAPLDPKCLKADGVFEGGGVLGIAFPWSTTMLRRDWHEME